MKLLFWRSLSDKQTKPKAAKPHWTKLPENRDRVLQTMAKARAARG